MNTIYLDNAATSPLDPHVAGTMKPFLKSDYGNASSIHHMGRKSSVAVETWRAKIAKIIGAQSSEVLFTSGGTESNNAAIFGTLENRSGKQIITAKTEHNAVLYPVEHAKKMGYEVIYADIDDTGKVTPKALRQVITKDTALVSLMHVNNETGVINPISELAEICKDYSVPIHCDAVQSVGKIPVNVDELGVDLLSMSAHKFHGPKGAGALYVRSGTPWATWMHGGSQERGRRGGTLNVPGIAGMGKALEIAVDGMDDQIAHIKDLQHRLHDGLSKKFGDLIRYNGDIRNGIHHIVSVTVADTSYKPLDGEMLLLNLDIEGICCSNGSACTSGTIKPSHVMLALGMSEDMAKSTLRFSLGKYNTADEIDKTVDALYDIVARHSDSVPTL